MDALGFYLTVPWLWLLSLLPFWLLYRVSDLLQWLLFHGVRYRRRVVAANLRAAFPGKSDAERAAIERAFYRHFVDLLLETVKEMSAPKRVFESRVTHDPSAIALTQSIKAGGRGAIALMGHCGNWEWEAAAYNPDQMGPRLAVLYAPLHNRYFDRLVLRLRSRFGTMLIPAHRVVRALQQHEGGGVVFAFIADQTAQPVQAYWTTFLNQDTAVFRGPERLARTHDLPVLYYSMRKRGRGQYRASVEMLAEHPREIPADAITERFIRRLEQDILAQPEIWLWSHRRWKYARPSAPLAPAEHPVVR